jgi:low temperature requirement protein LtrA
VTFGIGYLVVILLHAVLFSLAGDDRATTRQAIVRLGSFNVLGALMLIGAGASDGSVQTILWVTALVVTYAGPFITGVAGFTARPSHFVERHGLIVIIALGESVVAIGAGETGDVDGTLIGTAFAAIVLVSGLWWAYFDEEQAVAERALRDSDGVDRSNLARDVYSYLHIPIVLGVVLSAVGLEHTLAHSDESLGTVAAVALGGGVAAYFAALAAIRLRCGLRPQPTQLAAVVLACLAVPVATEVPALTALGGLALLTAATALADRYVATRRKPATATTEDGLT